MFKVMCLVIMGLWCQFSYAAIDEQTRKIMTDATQKLRESGVLDAALNVNDKAKPFNLKDASGKAVSLSSLLEKGPVVITFYRGGWCPYCNTQLIEFQQYLDEIKALGASLVAMSPELPDNSLTTSEKNNLLFHVLSDVGNHVANAYGITFQLDESLRPIYKKFGIDVTSANGDESYVLPAPATFVVATDGTVMYRFVDADYTKRAPIKDIITTLKGL